ncbi:MAG: hypothetical protein IPG08_15455 [Sphingobacteriaceae bacterium]|nr:hypothetical protein [Sphingobacteriaceae bacterium]
MFSSKVHDYKKEEGAQSFRWILLNKLSSDDLTLIIDKRVVEMLLD